jgi:hypothetical protein
VQPRQALKAIREAFRDGRHFLHPHAVERMEERKITIHDLDHAIRRANEIEPYSGGLHDDEDSSSWRVTGPTLDDKRIAMGVQLTKNESGQIVIVVTLFEVRRRRRG